MKLLASLLMVLAALTSIAQKIKEQDVLAKVKDAFKKQYPNVSKVKWSKEDNNYEAEFELKEEASVLIDASGNILETEVEIEKSELPKEISLYIKSNYHGQSIKEAAKITDTSGTITYEAEIKGKDLIFDSSGKFLHEKKN